MGGGGGGGGGGPWGAGGGGGGGGGQRRCTIYAHTHMYVCKRVYSLYSVCSS